MARSTIGEKRNWLLEQAKGEYVVFVDDDDLVTNNYVQSIMKRMNTNKMYQSRLSFGIKPKRIPHAKA